MDLKYDILKHPSVRMTTDGKADPYIHGEPWRNKESTICAGPPCCKDAGSSIELVYDPELIRAVSENAQVIELPASDYVLLSEEDVEKEIKQEVVCLS